MWGNSYQTLEPNTAYTYLVNDHWSHDAECTFLNLADETVAIDWPIPIDRSKSSSKTRPHPRLADVVPMAPKKTLVLGGNGQLGRVLRAIFNTRSDFTADEMTSRGLVPLSLSRKSSGSDSSATHGTA